jgi:hypothetical protein
MLFSKDDIADWLVMTVITNSVVVATVFLFEHPTDANFVTWAAVVSTVGCVYHWLVIRDSKQPDAAGQ